MSDGPEPASEPEPEPALAAKVPRTDDAHDRAMLQRTLELAELGRVGARPNPVVGAVLALPDGTVLATGHHARYGAEHAERAALADFAGHVPEDATLYVSLEPCAHHGKQPPCSDLLIARRVRRVVWASPDTNRRTAGQGPRVLIDGGVEVARGPADLERQALQQNAGFHSLHLRGRPYVTWKWAMTRDLRLATGDPGRRWISSEASREHVHYLRAGSAAVMVGIGTVLDDDPLLTVRGAVARRVLDPPLRVVVDRELRLPFDSRLVETAGEAPVLVAAGPDVDPERVRVLRAAGVEVLRLPREDGERQLAYLMAELADRGVGDLLLESGPRLAHAMRDAGLVDALHCYVAPFEAPDGSPALEPDDPFVHAIAAVDPLESGVDEECIALLQPAWTWAGSADVAADLAPAPASDEDRP